MKMRFHSHGNEFNLHVNEISFSYERMGTKTHSEKEAKGNSEMDYLHVICYLREVRSQSLRVSIRIITQGSLSFPRNILFLQIVKAK